MTDSGVVEAQQPPVSLAARNLKRSLKAVLSIPIPFSSVWYVISGRNFILYNLGYPKPWFAAGVGVFSAASNGAQNLDKTLMLGDSIGEGTYSLIENPRDRGHYYKLLNIPSLGIAFLASFLYKHTTLEITGSSVLSWFTFLDKLKLFHYANMDLLAWYLSLYSDSKRSRLNKFLTITGTLLPGVWGAFYAYDKGIEAWTHEGLSEGAASHLAFWGLLPNAALVAKSIAFAGATANALKSDVREVRLTHEISWKVVALKSILTLLNLAFALCAVAPDAKFMADSAEKYYSKLIGTLLVLGVGVFITITKWDSLPRLEQKISIYPSGSFFSGKKSSNSEESKELLKKTEEDRPPGIYPGGY